MVRCFAAAGPCTSEAMEPMQTEKVSEVKTQGIKVGNVLVVFQEDCGMVIGRSPLADGSGFVASAVEKAC